jgi:hypothetical protein
MELRAAVDNRGWGCGKSDEDSLATQYISSRRRTRNRPAKMEKASEYGARLSTEAQAVRSKQARGRRESAASDGAARRRRCHRESERIAKAIRN